MREIKFRAWIREGEWVEPDEMEQAYVMCYDLAFEEYEPINDLLAGVEHLMQFTGLHDKNGKEIYEGDIIESDGILFRIEYSIDGNHAYYAGYCLDDMSLETVMELFDFGSLAVIGNIYENPELLEEK